MLKMLPHVEKSDEFIEIVKPLLERIAYQYMTFINLSLQIHFIEYFLKFKF